MEHDDMVLSLVEWINRTCSRMDYGEANLVIKIHENRIVQVEKTVKDIERPSAG